MIEVQGKLNHFPISILIYYGSSYNYVNTNLVERCNLEIDKFSKYRMVQLVTKMKRKITSMVKNSCLEMNALEEISTKIGPPKMN